MNITLPASVEPRFTLRQAAALLNITYPRMRTWVSRHHEVPTRYLKDKSRRLNRILYASELRYLNDINLFERQANRRLLPVAIAASPKEFHERYPTVDYEAAIKRAAGTIRRAREGREAVTTAGQR